MRDTAKAIAVLAMVLLAYASGFLTCYAAARLSEKQVVIQGERGPAGKDGRDCDCESLKAEAMAIVDTINERLCKLEASKCKCEKSVIVRGKPYPCEGKR